MGYYYCDEEYARYIRIKFRSKYLFNNLKINVFIYYIQEFKYLYLTIQNKSISNYRLYKFKRCD